MGGAGEIVTSFEKEARLNNGIGQIGKISWLDHKLIVVPARFTSDMCFQPSETFRRAWPQED
jgi:hypothetical protein